MQPQEYRKWSKKELISVVGSLSKPGKMPGYGYGLPAQECKVGAKLRNVKGSTCANCYALKGMYRYRNVKAALYKRLDAVLNNPLWEFYMIELIGRTKNKHFRWHDSGDLQSLTHLRKICFIAEQLPEFNFWIPTREYKIVKDYKNMYGDFPPNLAVRLSAHMVNGRAPSKLGLTSTVTDKIVVNTCPATSTDKKTCKEHNCTLCWDTSVPNINYLLH